MNNLTEELQLYFARIKPIYRELFGMAHAICGNYETAEYVLQRAVLEGWTRNERSRRRVGFRESVRGALKRIAVQEAARQKADAEMTWNGLVPDAIEDVVDAELDNPEDLLLLKEIHKEDTPMRRMIMLRFGCGMRAPAIAHLLGMSAKQVQAKLEQFEARTRRKLPAKMRRHYDAAILRVVREDLRQTSANVPDPGTVYRTFEVEASQGRKNPRKYASRAVGAVLFAVLALFCAAIFWLIAVLIQAPQVEQPQTPVPAIVEDGGAVENLLPDGEALPAGDAAD